MFVLWIVVVRGRRQQLVLLAVATATSAIAACASDGPTLNSGAQRASKPGLPGLQQQASQLLDGGPSAFKARLAQLRGHTVVVNQWASWCGPCRAEFPFFARQARKHRGRVGFLGVNSQDNRGDATDFLKDFPVPYPHYFDPDGRVARIFRGGRAFPTTAFYSDSGKLVYTHIGAYASEAELAEEIRKYTRDG